MPTVSAWREQAAANLQDAAVKFAQEGDVNLESALGQTFRTLEQASKEYLREQGTRIRQNLPFHELLTTQTASLGLNDEDSRFLNVFRKCRNDMTHYGVLPPRTLGR